MEQPQQVAQPASSHEVMDQLFSWMMGSDEVAQRMEQFAMANCHLFDYIEDRSQFEDAENKLVYTEVYNNYQAHFEAEINYFLSQMGWDVNMLIHACQEEGAKDESGGSSMFSVYELLIGLSDYTVFKVMMLDTRKKVVEEQLAQQQQQPPQ